MTRAEHLRWCKDRAIAYIRAGNKDEALTSMLSDLGKHPETQDHPAIQLAMMLKVGGQLRTLSEIEKFILGFN